MVIRGVGVQQSAARRHDIGILFGVVEQNAPRTDELYGDGRVVSAYERGVRTRGVLHQVDPAVDFVRRARRVGIREVDDDV